MAIVASDIAKVRAATDIVAIIGEHTEIKRSGRQWMARCPLHGERTPSLSVSPEKGVYYCFGCQRSGDVFSFVQEIEGIDFIASVEALAARAGITLHYTSRDFGKRDQRKRLIETVSRARDFYHKRLLSAADAGPARNYLRSRGYDGDLVRRWQIGWAPRGWDNLVRYLKASEVSEGDLLQSGLGIVNRRSRLQDFFRGRVLFPITNERGDPVGFGGRILPTESGPKYINTSSEARIYDKGRLLYGLYEHRKQIVKEGMAILCEGYTDVIGCSQAGAELAVATCGTALTEAHLKLLQRFSASRLVLAFDADTAGFKAAGRIYEWERKYELEVLVASLPEGQDPGDLARNEPQRLVELLEQPVPFLQFRLDRELATSDMSSYERRARTAERAVAIVSEHPDDAVRDKYMFQVEERCEIDIDLLRRFAKGDRAVGVTGGSRRRGDGGGYPGAAGSADVPASGSAVSTQLRRTPEGEALRMAIHLPEVVGDILHPALFGDPTHREALKALGESGSVVGAAEAVSSEAAHLLHQLCVEPPAEEVSDVLASLARLAAARAMRQLRRMAGATSDPESRKQCIDSLVWLKQQSELLSDRNERDEFLEDLLVWLTEHAQHQGGRASATSTGSLPGANPG